jgi:hypothetical protein
VKKIMTKETQTGGMGMGGGVSVCPSESYLEHDLEIAVDEGTITRATSGPGDCTWAGVARHFTGDST